MGDLFGWRTEASKEWKMSRKEELSGMLAFRDKDKFRNMEDTLGGWGRV
jgi:hypothetical protein